MFRSASASSWRFRGDIEGLRAVAIIGVILFHAGVPSVSGGFLGVDVFFVISGFLITGILIAEVQATGTVSLPSFWARRIRRLLPAATLVALVTLMLSAAFDSPFAQQDNAKSAIAVASYASNMLFMRRGADYFDRTVASDPYLHTWSLGVEEQYYLVFAPLCFLLGVALRERNSEFFPRRILTWTVVVTIISFAGCLVLTAAKPLISFYSLPSRAWEFGVGGVLSVPALGKPRETLRWQGSIALGALLSVVAAWFMANSRTPHPGWITLLPVLGTAALIHVGGRGPTLVGRLLETGAARTLGRLSYSWYLWHWPLTVYWQKLPLSNAVPLVLGMPLASLALAWFTYVTIEAPARETAWLRSARRGLMTAAVLAVTTVASGLALIRHGSLRLRDPVYAFILNARNTQTRIYDNGCHLSLSEVDPKPCTYGNQASPTVVVLFGDSHAAQWFSALEPMVSVAGWQLVPMTKSGCPAISVTVWHPAVGRAYAECDRWRLNVFEQLRRLQPAVVVVTNSNWYDIVGTGPGNAVTTASLSPAVWRQGLQTTLSQLPSTSAILLLEDTPNPPFDVPTCLFQHVHDVERCAFRRAPAIARALADVMREVGREDQRVTYVDVADQICSGESCRAAHGDTALFRDDDHLSVVYAASLSSYLLPVFRQILTDAPRPAVHRPM